MRLRPWLGRHPTERGLEQGRRDMAALARAMAAVERRHDPERRPHAGAHIDDRPSALDTKGPLSVRPNDRMEASKRYEAPTKLSMSARACAENGFGIARCTQARSRKIRGFPARPTSPALNFHVYAA